MARPPRTLTPADVRDVVRAHLPARPSAATRRETKILAMAQRLTPVPVPRPVLVVPDLGCLAYPTLPGVPLLDLRHTVAPFRSRSCAPASRVPVAA